MRTDPVGPDDLRGVFAVPPLARKADAGRRIDFDQNRRMVDHMAAGGIRRLLYGGNAFLYHVTLSDYEQLLGWLASLDDDLWCIPSAGPSLGRACDQASLLRQHGFPCVMMLPCGDPRDASGIEAGYREFVERAGSPLIAYVNSDQNLGTDVEAGLDALARLVRDEVVIGIKYSVVRRNPADDPYLAGLLARIPRELVLSGMGERPAVVHLRDWGLPGFTTGSGCVNPRLSMRLYEALTGGEYGAAEAIRAQFLPHEDLRDAWGAARVLHASMELCGIAETGAIPPYVTALGKGAKASLGPCALALRDAS